MPSQKHAGALLALAAPLNDNDIDKDDNLLTYHPWSWSAWQQRTGISKSPFSHNPEIWKDNIEAEAVKSFADSFWEKSDAQRVEYMVLKSSDNHSHGRKAWNNFVRDRWNRDWKMDETIMEILAEKALDPYSCMRRAKSPKVGFLFHIKNSALTFSL